MTPIAWLVVASGVALVVEGCSTDGGAATSADAGSMQADASCAAGFLGDPTQGPVLELRALRADGMDVPLEDGDDLAVIFPPQGGRVAFVGVRATNLDGCGVQVIGALRDPISKQVRIDGRTVNLRGTTDGWGTTGQGASTNLESSQAIGDYSNIPLCPNQWASQDVFDRRFDLEVRVEDRRKKSAVRTIGVVPRCAESGVKEAACRCLCRAGYVLGESCGEVAAEDGGQ